MTTEDNTGNSEWFITNLWAESRRTEEFGFFSLVIMKSVTADGSLLSPTGGVEELNPAPHIHEQMTMANYVQMATTLRTTLRTTTSCLSTMR